MVSFRVRKIYPVFLLICIGLAGCKTTPYAPPPELVTVESISIEIEDFHGRPDAYATIKGRLSSNAAQLVDCEQYRKANVLYLEVQEQTPRGTKPTNLVPNPPFQTRIPLEILGLRPGNFYIVDANGVKTEFQIPGGYQAPPTQPFNHGQITLPEA